MSMLSLNEDLTAQQQPARQARSAAGGVTIALIVMNVIVFLVMTFAGVGFFSPSAAAVLPWGADFGPLTMGGQWWRLVTSCFLHFGIVHIGMNMFILLQIGLFTEMLYGKARFLALYLLAGIAGNVAGLFLHPNTVSAGASGAIFGLYGGLLAFLLVRRGVVPTEAALKVAKSAGIFIAYNFVYGLASPNTDLEAHIGGLVAGFVVGCVLAWSRVAPGARAQARGLAAVAAGAALVLGPIALLPKADASEREWYQQEMTGTFVPAAKDGRVVYSGTVSRPQAERVVQTLTSEGFFDGPGEMVQLKGTATGNSMSVELNGDERAVTGDHTTSELVNGKTIIKHEANVGTVLPWNDPKFLNSVRLFGPQVSAALGDRPLTIRLLNGKGQLRKEIPIDATDVLIGTRDHVQFSGQATAEQAQALGEVLRSEGFFTDDGGMVQLTKSDKGTSVAFTVRKGAWDDPRVIRRMQALGRVIGPAVGGLPVTLELRDNTFSLRRGVVVQ
jgi:rhomboid protease GluP